MKDKFKYIKDFDDHKPIPKLSKSDNPMPLTTPLEIPGAFDNNCTVEELVEVLKNFGKACDRQLERYGE